MERAKGIRVELATSCMRLRDLHVWANTHNGSADTDESNAIRAALRGIAGEVGTLHTLNYVSSPSPAIFDFFVDPGLEVRKVYPGEAALRQSMTTYWALGNDFVEAIGAVSRMSLDDLRDPAYAPDRMAVAKRSVVFM